MSRGRMSLKKIEDLKSDKAFRWPDLIVYGVIALIIAAIFLSVFLTRNRDSFQGIRAYVAGRAVFEYDFESGKASVLSAAEGEVEVIDGSPLKVRINVDDGYNIFEIDADKRSVKMVEADCVKRDCIYTPAITDNNGIIYCSPHGVRIEPFDFNALNQYIPM